MLAALERVIVEEQPDLVLVPGDTNSTLAVDPKSGKLVWYHQHFPNDQWDLDWAFERQLVDLAIDGVQRRVMITSGKIGIYDALFCVPVSGLSE